MASLLGAGSGQKQNQNQQGGSTGNLSVSPRHSVHGLQTSQQPQGSGLQSLDPMNASGEMQSKKSGRRKNNGNDSGVSSARVPSISSKSPSEGAGSEGGSGLGVSSAQSTNLTSHPHPSASTSAQSVASATSSSKPPGKSVGETVKTFRLYEALRHGDTAYILKTLRGSSGAENPSISESTRNQILHLAVQCAEFPVVEFILLHTSPYPPGSTQSSSPSSSSLPYLDLNNRDSTGNTPLHLATLLARSDVVSHLLAQPTINDSIHNFQGKTALDLARSPALFEKLDLARSVFVEETIATLLSLIDAKEYPKIEALLNNERVGGWVDLNTIEVTPSNASPEHPTSAQGSPKKKFKLKDGAQASSGGSTLLHEAVRRKDTTLIQLLLLHGADPFRRDKKGKLPQDVTKDEIVKAVLRKSPAATHAQRGIEERAVLGLSFNSGHGASAGDVGEQAREMKGYLKKWTNYTGGWKLRWFVLEDGVLSYYKHQDDIGSACRGAINMRIAKLYMDPQDKQRFEIQGKSSVKYHLKANHVVEAKRWYWTLNNAIQWAKDEAREEERRKASEAERMERLKELTIQQKNAGSGSAEWEGSTVGSSTKGKNADSVRTGGGSTVDLGRSHTAGSEAEFVDVSQAESKPGGSEGGEVKKRNDTDDGGDSGAEGEVDGDDDDSSSNARAEPPTSDALGLAANSARLQLDLLAQVCMALQYHREMMPGTTLEQEEVASALESYEGAVLSLKRLVGDLLKMSKERDRHWRYRLSKEQALRRMWEENMQRLALEQEELEEKVGEERGKRKKAKRVLKEVLKERENSSGAAIEDENAISPPEPKEITRALESVELDEEGAAAAKSRRKSTQSILSKPLVVEMLSDSSGSDDEDEFFDAVDAGEVKVMMEMPKSPPPEPLSMDIATDPVAKKTELIKPSFLGYEDPPRERLKLAEDDRPTISLWGILKSMIGKDMTKMTLPVSFNECTSLLQRVAEDMEYTNLLDTAADRAESTERMVYVAAFAASEYSSTINRVAKPFNPLLGETYEYVRPDKGYRFLVEQVSHHPPIGAAWAESPKWDYWGESAVKSKFYGKSFDINPLGTWFLRLRPVTGGEELYTWKKVTTSVIGIITGSPTVDNYGLMEITNHTTGDTCLLDFKPRGWRVANAYEVKGKVLDNNSSHIWSIGGRWNDKIYARRSLGSTDDGNVVPPSGKGKGAASSTFLIWENHPRPPMPFNLTPFAVTLNALPERLKPHLCPTDTRLRPDQRAMEDGEYDFAATEKNRLEEKQRATRREREAKGEEYEPRWFTKKRCQITGEVYWAHEGGYWETRRLVSEGKGEWKVQEIF